MSAAATKAPPMDTRKPIFKLSVIAVINIGNSTDKMVHLALTGPHDVFQVEIVWWVVLRTLDRQSVMIIDS
jgi:hypothetical protein